MQHRYLNGSVSDIGCYFVWLDTGVSRIFKIMSRYICIEFRYVRSLFKKFLLQWTTCFVSRIKTGNSSNDIRKNNKNK